MNDTGTSACASTLEYPISPCPTPTTSVGIPTTAYTGSDVGEMVPGIAFLFVVGALAVLLTWRRSR